MIIVVVVVVIIVITLPLILGDASSAEWDLSLRRLPFADAVEFGRVSVVACITFRGFAHNRATCAPAAVGDIVMLELGRDGKVAGEHDASKNEKLLGAHDVSEMESENKMFVG